MLITEAYLNTPLKSCSSSPPALKAADKQQHFCIGKMTLHAVQDVRNTATRSTLEFTKIL